MYKFDFSKWTLGDMAVYTHGVQAQDWHSILRAINKAFAGDVYSVPYSEMTAFCKAFVEASIEYHMPSNHDEAVVARLLKQALPEDGAGNGTH